MTTPKSDATIYSELNQTVERMNVSHREINPRTIAISTKPLEFTARDVDGLLVTFKMSEKGAGCFQWFQRGYKLSDNFKQEHTYAKFTQAVRNYQERNLTDAKIKSRQLQLITKMENVVNSCFAEKETLWLHLFGDEVVGATRQWNDAIIHDHIVEAIKENGMIKKVVSHHGNHQNFRVDMKINDGDTRFLLRVENGHSGHETLNYTVIARFNNWVFQSSETGAARHLSNLKDVFKQIDTVMEKMRHKNLAEKLSTIDGMVFLTKLLKDLHGRDGINPDKYVRGDWRIKAKFITDVQAEKIEALINLVKSRSKGMKLNAFSTIEMLMEIATKQRGAKLAAEVLVNAVLSDFFDDMK